MYLDRQGLLALWREGLLARAALRGRTKGYRRHPQLERFRAAKSPAATLDAYLQVVRREAAARGYSFDGSRIGPGGGDRVPATRGQLRFEWAHLMRKLRKRAPELGRKWSRVTRPRAHPLFVLRTGAVEPWERGNARMKPR